MPENVNPMLAATADAPFDSPEWIFELKWDGYRALCYVENGRARMVSRNRIDLGARFPALADVPNMIQARDAILDGELVALDKNGIPRFQLLQPSAHRHPSVALRNSTSPVVFYVFDIVYCDGYDLRGVALGDRKQFLRDILIPNGDVRYSDHIARTGSALFREARNRGLEGVMAKRVDSTYASRRSRDWLKLKIVREADVVIAGYTEPRRSRPYLGSLVSGQYDNGELVFTGHVGVGMNAPAALRALYERLAPLETGGSPFAHPPKTNEPVHWLRPELVAEVKFSEWTRDRSMRHPILLRLRDDKDPAECVLDEATIDSASQ